MKPAIRIDQISKQYRLGVAPSRGNNLTENVRHHARNAWDKFRRLARPNASMTEAESFWALKDVSFDVQPGEVIGIIGRNGAGKSTLLKILSQIVEPTSGRAELRGRLGSLLEVGTGFHPELTGRENVYLNGAILGMSRKDIARKFDEIAAFAEVDQFLDTPVKRYSSGMYVRLAFSVAAHLEPDILIIDEVLAVGDATFQRKCIGVMKKVATSGRTVVFVSHNMDLIPRLCQKAVLLERGSVAKHGDAGDVTRLYLEKQLHESNAGDLREAQRTGSGQAQFVRAYLGDSGGTAAPLFISGTDLVIYMEIDSTSIVKDVALAVVIRSAFGMRLITSWTREHDMAITLQPGLQRFSCCFYDVTLRPGHTIVVDLWMASGAVIDSVENAMAIQINGDERHTYISTNPDQGVVLAEYRWEQLAKT